MNLYPKSRLSLFRVSFVFGIALLGSSLFGAPAQGKVHLKIAAIGSASDSFNNWIAGVGWEEIDNYKNTNASRAVIDLLLQLKALKAGGLDFDYELVRTLTYELSKVEVIQGRAILSAETIWDNELAENEATLLKGPVILRNGEFEKGIYTLPTHQKLLGIKSLDELREYTCSVVTTWALDVNTIEAQNVKAVVKKPTPELSFTAIQKGQADFTLAEFSNAPDMAANLAGVKLIPVPNCKVAIIGSRSWCVGKASPHADAVLKALIAGEKILRENGTIERAYRESGFFHPAVANWKRLF